MDLSWKESERRNKFVNLSRDEQLRILYEWTKTGTISKVEFVRLVGCLHCHSCNHHEEDEASISMRG